MSQKRKHGKVWIKRRVWCDCGNRVGTNRIGGEPVCDRCFALTDRKGDKGMAGSDYVHQHARWFGQTSRMITRGYWIVREQRKGTWQWD